MTCKKCQKEIEEQCVLLAKSGCREASLLAKIERLNKEIQTLKKSIEGCASLKRLDRPAGN
jgi:septal ring factor EnvC (AmiA/AmiB activator)